MKTNLQNRVKWKGKRGYGEHHYFQANEKWFEDFEKELKKERDHYNSTSDRWGKAIVWFIENKILGESK